jgi:hypothetical protein
MIVFVVVVVASFLRHVVPPASQPASSLTDDPLIPLQQLLININNKAESDKSKEKHVTACCSRII